MRKFVFFLFVVLFSVVSLVADSDDAKAKDPRQILKKMDSNPEQFLDILLKMDYKLHNIPEYENKIIPIEKKDVLRKYPGGNGLGTGLLCSKKEIIS